MQNCAFLRAAPSPNCAIDPVVKGAHRQRMSTPHSHCVEIDTAQPEHEAQIRALSAQTQRRHEDLLPHIFYDSGAQHHQLLDTLFSPDGPHNIRAFVALKADALVGYALVIPGAAEDAGLPINALIADICVRPEFQRKGVASALLAHCEAEKERLGWESLRAQVWQGNVASHHLFAAAGYTAERTDYRLGTPSVPAETVTPSQNRWLAPLAILIAFVLLAYVIS